ncbi:hypothetical protein C8Q73DRAFT_749296 [Cubamyces lactineus]|nr:hypothetical protein C8Q73DRAFT_749296 [Cubamyces lactineus]
MTTTIGSTSGVRHVKDKRTWKQRVQNAQKNWDPLLPQLVDAYLAWRYSSTAVPPPDQTDDNYAFTIDTIDIYAMTSSLSVSRTANQSASEALVRHGFVGNSPVNPSVAISLKTLELLRCLKLVKPSFSVEAFAKLVCLMYSIPYRPSYRTAISDAFAVYLRIQRLVQSQVLRTLARDTANWRARNACPACSYKLEGEDPPTFSRIICIDGNNSLKRLATTGRRTPGDIRVFEESDYFLSREYVDRFGAEVKARQVQPKLHMKSRASSPDGAAPSDQESDEEEDSQRNNTEGDPTDGSTAAPSPCAKTWKAAAADEKKHTWGIFDETGIFACACRHGLILWLVDMVRSGELAKYALAIVAKAHEVLGANIMIGYDIGCAFKETVRNSSLGPQMHALGTRFCVNAFHGYSHAYDCQVMNHPNTIQGMGLEDGEVLERVFSASNQLAPVIRYSTPYLRRVLIDLHFQQWDHEKYSNIGLMLYNNIVQALDIVNSQTSSLEQTLSALELTREDLVRFEEEERKFFAELRDESDSNLHAVAYVEALQELRTASEELLDASRRFNQRAPDQPTALRWEAPRSGATDYDADLSQTRKLETRRRYLRERVKQLTEEVNAMEVALNITSRWQPGDTAYRETLQYIATRKYQRALGKLQRLVIQRLFELNKLNLAQTGYRMRTYIAKNLQRRCRAIRKAVKQYNAAARELDPPRDPLDWSKVSHYAFLEEFTLLQDTGNDLRAKPWSQPAVRETMRMARRITRAQEEISNASREARRAHTFIRDEEKIFAAVLADLKTQGSYLYGAVQDYVRHRRAANAKNLAYILRIHALDGFDGQMSPGSYAGDPIHPALALSSPHTSSDATQPGGLSSLTHDAQVVARTEEGEASLDDGDDLVHEEVTAIMEFLAGLRT